MNNAEKITDLAGELAYQVNHPFVCQKQWILSWAFHKIILLYKHNNLNQKTHMLELWIRQTEMSVMTLIRTIILLNYILCHIFQKSIEKFYYIRF